MVIIQRENIGQWKSGRRYEYIYDIMTTVIGIQGTQTGRQSKILELHCLVWHDRGKMEMSKVT